jgi:hypothetical protein
MKAQTSTGEKKENVRLGIAADHGGFDLKQKLAPEAGLEPATSRLIPTRRDSTIEQRFPDPLR